MSRFLKRHRNSHMKMVGSNNVTLTRQDHAHLWSQNEAMSERGPVQPDP